MRLLDVIYYGSCLFSTTSLKTAGAEKDGKFCFISRLFRALSFLVFRSVLGEKPVNDTSDSENLVQMIVSCRISENSS